MKNQSYQQIEQISPNGILHFNVDLGPGGWVAQCEEITGIITGGKNSNPSQEEIHFNIQDAVYTVFDVNTRELV